MASRERSIYEAARACLAAADPDEKVAATRAAVADWATGALGIIDTSRVRDERPGLPASLTLVSPLAVPKRRLNTRAGATAFVHAIAHIEFNAINLAWDCVQRFRDLPREYYADWIAVAVDEAEHFSLLAARLADFGCRYGDFPAHDGLWEMAEKTADDAIARMALVPRFLEARGLDVTPSMIVRLERAGDSATAEILRRILREEVAHVAAGSRWFRYLCEQRGIEPEAEFIRLLTTRLSGRVRGPLNEQARARAGFTARELAELTRLATR
jgi:uncharacterized ferritin-like protein (DUF455 family)